MRELIVFTSVPRETVTATLTLGNGVIVLGHPAVHPTGREGIGFTIPDDVPNGWQATLELSAPGQVRILQKAILWLHTDMIAYPWTPGQTAAFAVDDFFFVPETICPPPDDPPPPPTTGDPFVIIQRVYDQGGFDLRTKTGCGQFTEAAAIALHTQHSTFWGHIKKIPPQNNYNGHAVDAVMLLVPVGGTLAGIYDIIFSSESPEARPAFNRQGDANQALWYYPA